MPSADLAYLIRNQAGLEAICQTPGCGHVSTIDVTALASKHGDQVTLDEIEPRLKCSACGKRNVRLEPFAKGHGAVG